MKKLIYIFLFVSLFTSCGLSNEKNNIGQNNKNIDNSDVMGDEEGYVSRGDEGEFISESSGGIDGKIQINSDSISESNPFNL